MGRFERRWRAASRRNWAILVAFVAFVVFATWIALGERAAPAVVLLPAPSRPAPGGAAFNPATSVDPPATQTQFSQQRVDHSGQVEVCGVGWVKADAERGIDKEVLERLDGVEAEAGHLVEAMASSNDEFERAATLWLRALQAFDRREAPANPEGVCEGDACAFIATTTRPADALLELLAQQAIATRDPRVYSLAYKACKGSHEGTCGLLTAARWAQLDGENGDPWLYVMAEAAARKDTAQIEEAIHRIGVATRVDARSFAVPRAIVEHAAASDAGLQAANAVTILAIGGMAAWPLTSVAPLTRHCRGADLGDANRRQRCEAAASALAERSDNLFYTGIGASMGRQLGWSESRVDAVHVLSSVVQELARSMDSNPLTWSCKTISTMLARMSRQGVVGETGFAREWIVASGMTLDQYAVMDRERRRRNAEAFRAAASAASVPVR